ncbi:Baculoviral IAP repeat-containing protein 3 [Wickerhamomyces ciferrii]|uniref:Baculoviral IAP repeat-containing protein 3 n=1 Tax=Wickerhamomyces ciferrii (strain ATCC 14091 / BCRC 22168 / CBS 111 / JCM 3599 / NBRC 0793 / NRRL Y-1031 F-60-10) TaxID=1206466 RepID=K0K6Q1_WICCF|nr:Baculoviral IAP repeat-containing protein 3 [Wickerhamomyces ciferrii]CCH40595.1 Baculoviral IAP repeat-containing protein 3 [Wickerhamomyces ciferrii]
MSLKKYSDVSQRASTFEEVKVQGKTFAWPYETPSSTDMAKLGFYYNPSKSLNDRIKCFWCKKTTGNWKTTKDLVRFHLDKSHDCLLSNTLQLADILSNDLESHYSPTDLMLQDPLSTDAFELRLQSFGEDWYADKEKNAIPTSKNLAAAGFFRMDDAAYCIHCHVSLEGWSNDDHPISEHRLRVDKKKMKCYFLDQLEKKNNHRTSLKRDSSVIEEAEDDDEEENQRKTSGSDLVEEFASEHQESQDKHTSRFISQSSEIASSLPSSRILRKKQKTSYNESDDEQEDAASFGITANDEDFKEVSDINKDSVEDDAEQSDESFEIDQPKKSSSKSKLKSKTKENKKSNTEKLVDKSKNKPSSFKSKILDSSFDENDLFATNKVENLNMSLQSDLKSLSPERNTRSISPQKYQTKSKPINSKNDTNTVLNDITNTVSKGSSSFKKSVEAPSLDPESEDDDPILLVSNSTTNSNKSGVSSNSNLNGQEIRDEDEEIHNSSSRTIKPPKSQDSKGTSNELTGNLHHSDSNGLKIQDQSKELGHKQPEEFDEDEQEESEIKQSPKRTKQLKKIFSSSSPLSSGTNSHTDIKSSKSMWESISRLVKSPGIERSRSPFLDASYKGSDKVEDAEVLIGPDDIPLEESTDHHIVLDKDNTVQPNPTALKEIKDHNSENVEDSESSSTSSKYHSAENVSQSGESDDDGDDGEKQISIGLMDTNDLFEHLEPIETAKNYLGELKGLGYELNDDTDGRVSYFINEMPDNEINMTVSEWIKHSALQGSQHVKELGQMLIQSYDIECEKIKEKIRNLPTA